MRSIFLLAAAISLGACGNTATGGDGGSFQALQPCANASDYMTGGTMIQFGGALGTNYSPKCLTVPVGSTVTFSGDFTSHPLRPSTRGSTGNPIPSTSLGMTVTTPAFTAAGFYPYFCSVHGDNTGLGMSGVIQVQ
jgi:plastocyanin